LLSGRAGEVPSLRRHTADAYGVDSLGADAAARRAATASSATAPPPPSRTRTATRCRRGRSGTETAPSLGSMQARSLHCRLIAALR